MIFISHRGNITGPNPKLENKPSYIESALNKKYDVEIDIWYDAKKWWLGHDEPQYKINIEWTIDKNLWIHCKNIDALCQLTKYGVDNPHYFWHEHDSFTLTSYGFIWTYPRRKLSEMSICVLPEIGAYTKKELKQCFGICSDRISDYINIK